MVVDSGLNQIGLTVPFYDLSGASRSSPQSVHIDTAALLETAGVTHPNALQIKSIDLKGVSVGTSVGFSLKHDMESMNAVGRHAYADHITDSPSVAIFHHVATPGLDIPPSTIQVVPTAAEMATQPQVTAKLMTPTWADMTPAKIATGVQVATCDGEERMLVPMGLQTEKQSGIARLLAKNMETKSFFGGRYSASNLKKNSTIIGGVPHAVMLKADFDTATHSLKKSMEITNPFGIHGLTIYAHPLTPGDAPASPGTGAVAHLTITRTKFGDEHSWVNGGQSKVLMSHITSVANGEPIKAQQPLLAGFDHLVNSKRSAADVASSVTISPYTADAAESAPAATD